MIDFSLSVTMHPNHLLFEHLIVDIVFKEFKILDQTDHGV
jgi:hypothetical protein